MNRSDTDQRPWWVQFAFLYVPLGFFFGWYAPVYLRRYHAGGAQGAAVYACLMMLLALSLAPGFPAFRCLLRGRVQGLQGSAYAVLLFLAPYLVYCAGTGDFRWPALARLFGLSALPCVLFTVVPARKPGGLNWQDTAVLLGLILPLLFGKLTGIWNVPVNLDFMARLYLLGVGSWSFLIFRGVEGSGYEFRFSPANLRDLCGSFLGVAAIALLLGFSLGFIAWNPQWRGFGALLFDYATIFLFVALLEELLFRGILQNLLEGSLHSRYAAQALAAVLFGMSHIRHAPFPNWRYVALASVAGWFYGSAYRANRSLMASAATHALVDTLWRTWFTLPRF